MDAPTAEDLFQVARAEALLGLTRFDKEVIDLEGSDVNVVFRANAAMGEEVGRLAQRAVNRLTISGSFEDDLDRVVIDQTGGEVIRKGASAAIVTVQLTRTGTTGIPVPEGTLVGTDTGIVFATVAATSFGNNQQGPLLLRCICQKAGRIGVVEAGTVTRLLSPLQDPTVRVTNPERAAGGADRESDQDYKARARAFFPASRRATKGALELAATNLGSVSRAEAVELLSELGIPVWRVQLFLADQDGASNSAIAEDVAEILPEYRAWGSPVQAVPSTPQYVEVVFSGLKFKAGAVTAEILSRARAAIVAAVNATPPGGTLYKNVILGALNGIAGLIVPEGSLLEPAGDLIPDTGRSIRTTAELVRFI